MSLMLQPPLLRWKEWIPLVTHQQRLRNLVQIIGFNINLDHKDEEEDVSYYYTLHLSTMCAPFYTSEKLAKDNPMWSEVNFHYVHGSATGVVIRLWKHVENVNAIITVWGVYFNGLSYIGPQLFASDCASFCANTLILYMHGGYFTSPDFFKEDQPTLARITAITLNRTDLSNSYQLESLLRLHSVQRTIKELSEEACTLHDKILSGDYIINNKEIIRESSPFLRKLLNQSKPDKRSNQETIEIKKNIEITKFRVQLLQEEKSRILTKLQTLVEKKMRLNENNQENGCKLLSQHHALSKEMERLKERKKSYFDMKEELIVTSAQFILRQKQIIVELGYIYPISKSPDGKYKICDVILPNSENFDGYQELDLSAALGFTLHLVQMISYIINVPLRYPVVHYGSRSKIVDHINNKIPSKECEFCLFAKDKDRCKFNYAVYLLNKNIAQLRWYCGLGTSDLRATLPNLDSLIQSCFAQNIDTVDSSIYKRKKEILNNLRRNDTTSASLDGDLHNKSAKLSPNNSSAPSSLLPYEDSHSSESLEQDYNKNMYSQTWLSNGEPAAVDNTANCLSDNVSSNDNQELNISIET